MLEEKNVPSDATVNINILLYIQMHPIKTFQQT